MSTSEAGSPSDTPPSAEHEAVGLPAGWVRIGNRRWWSTWAGVSTAFFVLGSLYLAIQLGRLFWAVVPLPVAVIFGAIAAGGVLALITVIRNARYPQPYVNLETDTLRAGNRRTLALNSIHHAVVPTDPSLTNGTLILRLIAVDARVEIILRNRNGPRLDRSSTQVLAEALRRTAIAMPSSADDPTGRFARFNFPGHIDRNDAIALVENPPAPGAPLPASW
ncbi:hypothetical protein ACFXQA_04405 [Microbacterium sp. P07]|uniref:hypothetical protein n=1 Tax=Microbacterium sp. P07 TaxID=3366952 RepID=UPI0037452F2B